MAILETNELVKTFKTFSLGPLNLSVDAGCALGLVGANGAGKTTLFRCIMSTVRKDSGRILINDREVNLSPALWKQSIGYVGDYTPLFDNRTGYNNLQIISKFYPAWSNDLAESLARRLNLDLNQRVKNYSTGQRTKFAIVLALSYQPNLLILDEPTAGLDPVARDIFMEILFEQMESGEKALVYATHHISEIENLADRLVFISNGIVERDEIKEDLAEKWRKLCFRHEKSLASIPHVLSHKSEHPYYELISENSAGTLEHLQQLGVKDVDVSRLSIEQITVQILKDSAQEINHV